MIKTFYVSIAPACSLEMRIICILPWEQHKSLVRPNVRSLRFLNGIHKANGQPMANGRLLFSPLATGTATLTIGKYGGQSQGALPPSPLASMGVKDGTCV